MLVLIMRIVSIMPTYYIMLTEQGCYFRWMTKKPPIVCLLFFTKFKRHLLYIYTYRKIPFCVSV